MPNAVSLVHQLIHQQLRFLQMEYLFNQTTSFRVIDILAKPVAHLPARMQRTLKLLRSEIRLRQDWTASEENVEIEPIPDPDPFPPRSKQDVYEAVVTPDHLIPKDRLAGQLKKRKERSHRVSF